MALKEILLTDTLSAGFRAKYNETIGEIIVSATYPATGNIQPDGKKLRLVKYAGGFIDINLGQFYFTKQEVTDLLNGAAGKTQVDKIGSNIADNYIDVSLDGVPVGKDLLAVYINGHASFAAYYYDPIDNKVYGFSPTDNPTDTITIKFI